jgi:orotate phosphoribosyltransferase
MKNLTSEQVAQKVLENKIIELSPDNPFTFASGIKSPVYCDGRKIISKPELRMDIAYSIAQQIKSNFPEVEVISGVATGSIAMAAWVSQILELPMIYYRKPKGYGHNNTVEGEFKPLQKVVVIEDTVSTGGSCLTAVNSLRQKNLDVLGVSFIYSHEMLIAEKNFKLQKCNFTCLVGLTDILKHASENNILNQDQIDSILKWKKDPQNWLNS